MGRDHLSNKPIRLLQPSRAESKDLLSAQVRGAHEGGATPSARTPSPLPHPSGGGLFGARAPAHLPGSAPRPAARSRPRAEATQSRSPTQRRWRRRQRRSPRGLSARALRAHLPHPVHRPGRSPAGLRWRRRQRRSKRPEWKASERPLPPGFGLPDPGTARGRTMASWGSYLPEADPRGCGYTFCSAARFAASASPSPAPLPPSCSPGWDSALRMRWYRL